MLSIRTVHKEIFNIKFHLIFAVLLTVSLNTILAAEIHYAELNKSETINWFNQTLDHFNKTDTRTWQMRYLANDVFFENNGPLFIFIGGTNLVTFESIRKGTLIRNMAKIHEGYLIAFEHRFYGQSKPFRKMTLKELKYLNIQQVLADLAHFIRVMKSNNHSMKYSKVILVGCSYGAALATWFKNLYPDLVAGVWASSATLLAKLELYDEKELLGQAIKDLGGINCYNIIKNGFDKLNSMLTSNQGYEVKRSMGLCKNFNEKNDLDVSTLNNEIAKWFSMAFSKRRPKYIGYICANMRMQNNELRGLLMGFLYNNKYYRKGCLKISYKSILKLYKNSSLIKIPRLYQQCNELGWFSTTVSPSQPFGNKIPLVYFTSLCADIFGSQFTEEFIAARVQETNEIFGGLQLNVENVYFTYGGLDPRKGLGLQDKNLSTILPYCSRCGDLGAITPTDVPTLRLSKRKIFKLVRKWLQ